MGQSSSREQSVKHIKKYKTKGSKQIKEIVNKNFLKTRIFSYDKIEKLLSSENQVEKCGLEPFNYKQIGSPSVSGIALRLNLGEQALVAKVLEETRRAEREAKYYEFFKKEVLNGNTPHFPLVWESLKCKDNCHFINPEKISRYLKEEEDLDKWEEIRYGKCFMIFVELFKGDSERYCFQYRNDQDRLASVISQVMMGMYTLRKKGLSHDDLHLKNVLYTPLGDQSKGSYFKYVIEEEDGVVNTYHLKHFNHLFVLWDFERMKKEGEQSSYASDRLLGDYDIEEEYLVSSIYWDLTMFTNALSYAKKSKLILDLKDTYTSYTIRYYDNMVNKRYKYKDYTVVELLNKLCERPEFKGILLHNATIPESKVTATFYPNH
jgi:hypothetical protein